MVDQTNAFTAGEVLGPGAKPGAERANSVTPAGAEFKDLLVESIEEVNRLQLEADQARVNLATGETENVAEVFTAVKKAELAFQTLLQIRNKLMDAYDEVKQMRV